jgi:beta-galactosidase
MKKILPALAAAAIAGAATLAAVTVAAQTPRHLDPTVVELNKELPRSEVVSHDSKADAVRSTTGASKYLQPLKNWTRTESAEAVTYRTRFTIPFAWIDRRQFLYVGRASGSFDVVINGTLAAYTQTGSTPSEFDITAASKEGVNDLELVIYKDPVARKLENNRPAAAPAIEGEVHILSQPRIRVRDVAATTRMEGSSGLLELGVILKSHQLNAHDYTVYWELLNPAGEIVSEGKKDARLDMRREDTVRFFANIPRVVPWSHEEPRLYTLFIKTQNEGRFREYLAFRVGFRSLDLQDDGGLTLNGVPLALRTQEFAPVGDVAEMRRAIAQLRVGGVNTLMLRGAPASRGFFALCDSMGVYVACRVDIDTRQSGESRQMGGNPSNDPAWGAAYLDRVTGMYHTSKNHPSVAMFSLAQQSANGINLYDSYVALKALEPHRPVLYTDGGGEWNTDDLAPADGVALPPAEWLTLDAVDVAKGTFRVSNRREITPLNGEAIYKIVQGRRKVVSTGAVPFEALPGETASFTIPIAGVKPGKPYTVAIEIATESPIGDWLPDGDPNLKIFRRTDLPLPPASRTVIASGEFKSPEPVKK